MQEKAILVVSFGTSYRDTCQRTIGALESDFHSRFPDRKVYRAWTSNIIRRKLASQGEVIDSVEEAMDRMERDGIRDLLVQSTHMLPGEEYALARESVERHRSAFSSIRFGAPLLSDRKDLAELAHILESKFPQVEKTDLLVFMGHGSDHIDTPIYEELENCFRQDGFDHYCIGTVEFAPGFTSVLDRICREKPKKVYLSPLMVVAGDHANNDMAGEDPDSWKSQIISAGFETECILKGLGEYPEIREMYMKHAELAQGLVSGKSNG